MVVVVVRCGEGGLCSGFARETLMGRLPLSLPLSSHFFLKEIVRQDPWALCAEILQKCFRYRR